MLVNNERRLLRPGTMEEKINMEAKRLEDRIVELEKRLDALEARLA